MATDQPDRTSQTRDRILDAAWQLIEQRGAEITMAEVAKACGLSRQAVYLHFTNRSGLLIGLVEHMDRQLRLADLLQPVRDAATGREALERMVAAHATYHERIIGVARLLDAARQRDPDVAAAWEDRMAGRREQHRRIVQRIADDGQLAPGWDVETAGLLFYTVTLPHVWDELVTHRGWSPAQYREHLVHMLTRALLACS